MCICLLELRLPTHSPALSQHMGSLKLGSLGKCGCLSPQALCLFMDTRCEMQGAACYSSLQCWGWIQAEHLEGNEGLEWTWGRAQLGLQGLGH